MVRRIRICSTCSKRFIALHSTHYDCCRRRNDKNHQSSSVPTKLVPNPCAEENPNDERNNNHRSRLSEKSNLYHECASVPDLDVKVNSASDEGPLLPFHASIDDRARRPTSHTEPLSTRPSCSNNVVDLLSDDEDEGVFSEHEDENEPILVDFLEENDIDPNETAGLPDEDDRQGAASLDVDPMNGVRGGVDENICLVCGSSLAALTNSKSRIQHIKRCAKKHGVTASDVRFNDDYEQFVEVQDNESGDFPGEQEELSSSSVNRTQQLRNPYSNKRQQWHDDATTTNSAALPNVNGILMAGARRAAKVAQIQKMTTLPSAPGPPKRPRFPTATAYAPSAARSSGNCPKYKMIPGTDFCCDGFHYAKTSLTTNYFLTHFHSDHYGGISKHWNVGTIYCSQPTANLVHQQLGVNRQYLHPLPLYTPTVIASKGTAVTVTLLNANHCPGAIMFLFEVGKRVILHVGDFRWNYNIMSRQLPLRPYCRKPWLGEESTSLRRIDDLFLDTTYCDVQYDLPTQEECIEAVIKVAEKEMRLANSIKTSKVLMLFGAYTIGKEAVYMSVAKALGMKVYVDKRRYRILSTLGWSAEDISILTTDPKETCIWVVPLGHINMKKMASYKSIHMKGFSRDFDRVVGFRPTGWSLSSKKHKSSIIGTTDKGPLTLHTVPYSEHSSFPELVECLETLNPKRIVPTVSVNKSQQQIDLLLSHWREKQATNFVNN